MGQNMTGDKKELKIICEQPMDNLCIARMDISKDENILVYFHLKQKGFVAVEYQRWVIKEGRVNKLFFEPIVCSDKEEIIPAVKKAYARIILQKTEEAKKAYDALMELHKLLTE